jgi:preprotein translocase subunit SecG
MQQILLGLHVLIAVVLIVLVLIQQGKGADAGAAFGSGASGTMFGSKGSAPFLVKLTAVLAMGFFISSMTLTYLSSHGAKKGMLVMPASTPVKVPDVPMLTGANQHADEED